MHPTVLKRNTDARGPAGETSGNDNDQRFTDGYSRHPSAICRYSHEWPDIQAERPQKFVLVTGVNEEWYDRGNQIIDMVLGLESWFHVQDNDHGSLVTRRQLSLMASPSHHGNHSSLHRDDQVKELDLVRDMAAKCQTKASVIVRFIKHLAVIPLAS